MTISNGGSFLFNSASSDGLTGYFASSQSSGTITIGNASSGILTGSLQLVEIDTNTTGHPHGFGSFAIELTLTGMAFSGCTTQNCTNSALLQAYAAPGAAQNSFDTLNFSFTGTAQNASALLGMAGTHATTVQGSLDSYVAHPNPRTSLARPFWLRFLARGNEAASEIQACVNARTIQSVLV